MPSPTSTPTCKRCALSPSHTTIRNEPLCTDCLTRYIDTKVVKRMEAFRVRHVAEGTSRRLLLPLSGGLSSLCLLHILDEHLERQIRKSGRPRYELCVVHVMVPGEKELNLSLLKERWARYEFETISLENVPATTTTDSNSNSFTTTTHIKSPTSIADISSINLRNRLVSYATSLSCTGILFSQTTTSLAESILAATAKGRGYSLPLYSDADGHESAYGISVFYPMRDVLRKELAAYAQVVGLDALVREEKDVRPGLNGKDKTIDGLMREYFAGVEDGFPSVVANVVRTCGKLRPASAGKDLFRCGMCRLPFDQEEENEELDTRWVDGESGGEELCYGCRQSRSSAA